MTGIAIAGALTVLVMLGWWAPNVRLWQECGADDSFAFLRGLFEKPDVLTCIAVSR